VSSAVIEKRVRPVKQTLPVRISPLQWTAHLAAWIPLGLLALDALHGNLTANPIQYVTQHLGRDAILLLTAALAVTPLVTLTGMHALQKLARPLGLYAFFYAGLHLLTYVGVDYGFSLELLAPDLLDKSYIWLGVGAFTILLILAVTSFRWWMRRLRKGWKRLHQLVYAAGLLVVIHYGLAVKGDLLRLQGDVVKPAVYALIVLFLLGLRLPPIRKWVIRTRVKLVERIRV
jgi:methionine sulfoxide reductase heme-binding subunit